MKQSQESSKQASVYLKLFLAFFKIGAFTFGGGYAMIPLIHREAVEKNKWIDDEDMLDIIAVAESTPGPIAINSATFVGTRVAGVRGALMATLGVTLPSFAIILLLASLIEKLQGYVWFQNAFLGIRAGILALILKALLTMNKQCPKNTFSYVLILLSFALVGIVGINSIYVIVLCGFLGWIINAVLKKSEEGKKE